MSEAAHSPTVIAVVGNPRAGSRTRIAAEALAGAVATALGPDSTEPRTVDLAEFAGRLFDLEDEALVEIAERVCDASVVVFASPVYKAAYTGILKLFLDRLPNLALEGVVAVPLMIGGAAQHSLATELSLRPVLTELGAATPTRSLFVLESRLEQLDEAVASWAEGAGPLLRATVTALDNS